MKLFSKSKELNSESRQDDAEKGHGSYNRLQSGCANWMAKRTEKFSRSTWFVLLSLFVLFTGSYSIYLAVHPFTGKANHSINISLIKKPRYATESGEPQNKGTTISEEEHERINKFRLYMDSLAQSPSGKIIYDSIVSLRPGLMDSVRFIENYYQKLNHK